MKDKGKPVQPVAAGDVAAWQAKMRAVFLETVSADDVADILQAIMAQAKKGDLPAARFVLSYCVGNPARQESPTREQGPTAARPGTARKLDVLAHRYANGLELHAKGDGGKIDSE